MPPHTQSISLKRCTWGFHVPIMIGMFLMAGATGSIILRTPDLVAILTLCTLIAATGCFAMQSFTTRNPIILNRLSVSLRVLLVITIFVLNSVHVSAHQAIIDNTQLMLIAYGIVFWIITSIVIKKPANQSHISKTTQTV